MSSRLVPHVKVGYGMRIIPNGERYRARVTSASDPHTTYFIDLCENRGLGACDCADFRCKRRVWWESDKKRLSDGYRCKHIICLRQQYIRSIGGDPVVAEKMLDKAIKEEIKLSEGPKVEYDTPYRGPKAMSEARAKEMEEYRGRRIAYLTEHPWCEACQIVPKITRDIQQATDIHHKRGRIHGLLNMEEFWIAVCRGCHDWIGGNPEKADELGLLDTENWNTIPNE